MKAIVLRGSQDGRTIGFPTLNLDPELFPLKEKPGVYSSKVIIENKSYIGALYYGPRLVVNETKNVLEIHVLDFNQEIYNQEIEFKVETFIRGVMDFNSFDELKEQLQKDIVAVRKISDNL